MSRIGDLSAADASKMARDVLRRVPGLQPSMLQLLYHALKTDANDGEANLLLVQLADEFTDQGVSIAINDYVIAKHITDAAKHKRIAAEKFLRFYRLGLAKHVSGSEDFEMDAFDDPTQFVIDTARLDKLKSEAQKDGADGRTLTESLTRMMGHRAGLLKHITLTGEIPYSEFRHADRFAETEAYEKFLNATELHVDYSAR